MRAVVWHGDEALCVDTHRCGGTLEEAPEAYELFGDNRDGCMKVLLQPRRS